MADDRDGHDGRNDADRGGHERAPHDGHRSTRFRFKEKKTSRRRHHDSSRGHRSSDRHDHRSKRRRHDETHIHDGVPLPQAHEQMDPNAAFRESLFDAMADDEGADYWEGVYGQPIHIYSGVKQGPDGELERMTDDEYVAYVRRKMYEKTHQHLLEEKARRDAARKADQAEREQRAREGDAARHAAERFQKDVEESLRRGQARRKRKQWAARWDAYMKAWEELGRDSGRSMPWPVESGLAKDVDRDAIKEFFLYAPSSGEPTEVGFQQILKAERVRWHPDKIQQRLGNAVDQNTLQTVTAVFQVVDELWNHSRTKP